MLWLPFLLFLQWFGHIDARGLAIDYRQAVEDNVAKADTKDLSDDDHSGAGDNHNINFIYQFLTRSHADMFEEIKKLNDEEKTQDYEENVKEDAGQKAASLPVLLKPSEDGINERQNKVYWTDEELEALEQVARMETEGEATAPTTEVGSLGRGGRMSKFLAGDSFANNVPELSRILIEDTNVGADTPAQDRQLATITMSLDDLSVVNIEDNFQQIVMSLPNIIDKSRAAIVEGIATTNMVGYTVGFSYFLGAFLDTIGDFLVEERFLSELITDQALWFLMGWLWFYAAGFAGPWLFPSTFGAGNPNLVCSSVDFFAMLAESDLNLNINSITSRSQGEMAILSQRLRTDFNSRLGCIVHKKGKYKEAEQVHNVFERMLSLISLHHHLTGPDPGQEDIAVLDQELRQLWDRIPVLVEEVHEAVTISRANTAKVYFFVGLLNLGGLISGALLQATPIDITGTPPVAAAPGAFFGNVANITTGGQFSNEFYVGEGLLVAGQIFGWGYGYTMTYFLFMQDADPGCGLLDLDNVYSRYQRLSSIEVLLSTGQVKPATVKYFVAEWRRELGVALHCLLSTEEGVRLGDTLDMFVNLANSRLDLT